MRTDNYNFATINQSTVTEPRFVVELSFDSANTDVIYITSADVDGLSGENVYTGLLEKISGTSQKINPDKAVATIGAISFSALDHGLTSLIRDKLNDNKGLKGKRVRFWVGERSLAWTDYVLTQTQIVDDLDYKDGVYSVKCADIQRQMRKEIFDLKSTSLAATLEAESTVVQVYNTAPFEMVKHPSSATGRTDAPGQKVGYLRVEGNGTFEIIRYTGKTSTSFTGCERGVLGTQPLQISLNEGSDPDNAPKVTEYVYLEMPAPQLTYALLTGHIYGEAGETLPSHWHMGIPPEYIRTSDFVNIGSDLWNPNDSDSGLIARIEGVKKTDGKKFFEEQMLRMMACYSPIYSDGQIGLRRQTVIPSQGTYDAVLSESSVVSASALKHDMGAVINRMTIRWNWSELRGDYTRANVLIDGESIEEHGVSEPRDIELRALSGSQHSYETLKGIFDGLRDRHAGPPLRLTLTLTPPHNTLEVGDIVRVRLPHIKDFTGEAHDGSLDRNFEIQQVKTDWVTGRVTVELFGSSQQASALPPDEEGTPVAPEFFGKGTQITPENFPGAVTVSGGVTRITKSITLAGADNVNSEQATYSCPGDLTIDAGVTVKTTKNVQLRVNGFLQINGLIDSVGTGASGGVAPSVYADHYWTPSALAAAKGVAGFFGHTSGQAGWNVETGFSSSVANYSATREVSGTKDGSRPHSKAPELQIVTANNDLKGLPGTLVGTGGCAGQAVVTGHPSASRLLAKGSRGGNGGGGIVIICNGAEFGASGRIDTSGEASPLPGYHAEWGRRLYAGRGAGGAPGVVYWLLLNTMANAPTLRGRAVASYGNSDVSAYSAAISREKYDFDVRAKDREIKILPSGNLSWAQPSWAESSAIGTRPDYRLNEYQNAHRVQYVTGVIAPVPDAPATAEPPLAITLHEAINTPRSASANLSTIEVAVAPPSDSNYSYSWVQYRKQGQPGWFDVGPAAPEALIVVASDGATYEIRALSVSRSGRRAETGPVKTIAVTNVTDTAKPQDPAEPIIKIPNVHGLELFEQGHDTEFTGRDAKFTWRKTSITEWFEIGSEPQGASSGALDLYFRDYQVEIWAENQVVRTEWVVDNAYTYTYEKNAEDYQRVKGQTGAWREFAVRVSCRGRQNQLSKAPAVLNVSNPAPELPTNLTVSAGFKVAMVDFDPPADLDYKETRVYLSTESGFTPDESNRAAVTVGGPVTIQRLDDGATYYLRVQPFDAFGPGPLSSEFTVTTQELDVNDINGLSPWATVTEADREFIEQHLGDASIPGTKIEKITASQIVTGTLAATEKVSVEGQVEALAGSYAAVLGAKELNGKVALLSFTNGGIPIFALYEDGSASFRGSIEITGGTGYARLTDKPKSLSDINSTEADKLGGIQAGATAGAAWGTNLGNIPTRFGDNNTPSAPGLYLTTDYLGYHNGNGQISGWGAYIQKDGQFHFGGVGDNYIDWDGSLLSIVGNVQTSDGGADGQKITLNSALNQMEVWGNNGVFDGSQVAVFGKSTTHSGNQAVLNIDLYGSSTECVYLKNQNSDSLSAIHNAARIQGRVDIGGKTGAELLRVRGEASNSLVRFQQTGPSNALELWAESASGGRAISGFSQSKDGAFFRSFAAGYKGVSAIGGGGAFGYDFYAQGGNGYGPFTGAHDALMMRDTGQQTPGDIAVVKRIVAKNRLSDILAEVDISRSAMAKNTLGVVVDSGPLPVGGEDRPASLVGTPDGEYEALAGRYMLATVNALGEGQINVCSEGGDFEVGDFICTSSVPGKGMRYDGHDMRVVVAKILEPVNWEDEPETTKTVACIYMCG